VKIADEGNQRTINWQPWPYLIDLINVFQNNKEVVILKARQLGLTWLVVSYALWKVLFFSNTKVLLISKTGESAEELIGGGEGAPGKAKFIYSNLPDFMKLKLGRDTQGKIDFPTRNSSMQSLMSNEYAGSGSTASLVIRDELELHPCAELNYGSIRPTIDSGSGQLIDLSSPKKNISIAKSHFKTRYVEAKNGTNRAVPIFLPWHLRPIRKEGETLEDWFEGIKKDYKPWEVEQEYPSNEEEALGTLGTLKFFDDNIMKQMSSMIPLQQEDLPTHNGVIQYFKPPAVGERYVLFTDPSDGVEDPFHTVVVKHNTGEEVARAHGKVKANIAALYHDELVRLYNNAFNSYEKNGQAGGTFSEVISSLETPNMAARRNPDGKVVKGEGWYTTPEWKRKMLWDLEQSVRDRAFVIHDQYTIDEFNAFIIPEGGEPQATSGFHDDTVMAWAGVLQLGKVYISPDSLKITSGRYKG